MDDAEEKKRAKKRGRWRKEENAQNEDRPGPSLCTSCRLPGHRSCRSNACPNHKPSKKEALQERLGCTNPEKFTRKLPFHLAVRTEFQEMVHERPVALCGFVREVVFRAQLVVNSFIIANCDQAIPSYVYTQNFWYSVCQCVMGIPISNQNSKFPLPFLAHWEWFSRLPKTTYPKGNVTGYSDSLSAACKTIATTYSNNIVENFDQRVQLYLQRRLKELFPVRMTLSLSPT